MKNIVSNGVFTQTELLRYLAVRRPLGHETHYFFFPPGEGVHAAGILHMQWQRLAERFEKIGELLAIGPHLAFVNCVNAFAKIFQRLVAENHTMRAASKRVDHGLAAPIVEEHDGSRFQSQAAELAQDTKSFPWAVAELCADDRDIRHDFPEERQRARDIHRTGNNGHSLTFRPKRALEQLAVHLTRFRKTGFYDMSLRWVVTFRELLAQANQVLVPTISHLQERDPESIPVVYRESYRLIFFLAIPTFAFLIVISPIVSSVWIGRYEPIFVNFVTLLALGWLVNTLSNPAYVVDLGTGALRWVSVGCIVTAVLNAGLGFVAGKYIGGTAIVAASVISLILGYTIVVAAYHFENRVPFAQLLPKESLGIIVSSFAGAIIFIPLFRSSLAHSLFSLRVSSGIAAALLTMIVLPMWIHPMRKRLLNWMLSRLPA